MLALDKENYSDDKACQHKAVSENKKKQYCNHSSRSKLRHGGTAVKRRFIIVGARILKPAGAECSGSVHNDMGEYCRQKRAAFYCYHGKRNSYNKAEDKLLIVLVHESENKR